MSVKPQDTTAPVATTGRVDVRRNGCQDRSVSFPIAVSVIGGYLGSGKTTLVNRILRETGTGVAVLVNDFGSVNIDEALIESVDGDVVALTNGCICCTITDGFVAALDTIRNLPVPPSRLVIEASGVSDPRQVAAYGTIAGFELDGVIGLVDAEAVRRQAVDRYVGDLVVAQLAAADVLVLNKVDLVDSASLETTRTWVGERAPTAVIVDAVEAEVPLALVLGPALTAGRELDHPGFDAGDVFESWTFESPTPLDSGRLDAMVTALPDGVVRLKGVVRTEDEPHRRTVLQLVGRRSTRTSLGEWIGGPSRIVAIGHRGAIGPDWLDQRLRT